MSWGKNDTYKLSYPCSIQFSPVGDHAQTVWLSNSKINEHCQNLSGLVMKVSCLQWGSIYNTLPGKVVMQNGRQTINKATEGIIIKKVIKHWYKFKLTDLGVTKCFFCMRSFIWMMYLQWFRVSIKHFQTLIQVPLILFEAPWLINRTSFF